MQIVPLFHELVCKKGRVAIATRPKIKQTRLFIGDHSSCSVRSSTSCCMEGVRLVK